MLGGAAFLLVGVAVFWSAASFQGYISGLLLLAIAALGFVGAQELKRYAKTSAPAPAPGSATEEGEKKGGTEAARG